MHLRRLWVIGVTVAVAICGLMLIVAIIDRWDSLWWRALLYPIQYLWAFRVYSAYKWALKTGQVGVITVERVKRLELRD